MSYSARSGHSYGNQYRRGGSIPNYGSKNRRNNLSSTNARCLSPTMPVEASNPLCDETANLSMFVTAPETGDMPAWFVPLPTFSEINKQEKQAYMLSRVAADRQVEIILYGLDNKPLKKFRVERLLDVPNNQSIEDNTLLPSRLIPLKEVLGIFGYTIIESTQNEG